jgi:hypothetical protein
MSQNPSTTTFVVEDATIEQQLEQFGETKVLTERPLMPTNEALNKIKETQTIKPQRVDSESMKKLESILFLGRLTKLVEIAGAKFEISTLANKEQNDIVRELMNFGESADLFLVRTITLAHALKTVDGIKLDDMDVFSEEEEGQFTSKYKRRQLIVDNLQLFVVEKLFDEYNNLLKENESLVAKDTIKK